MGVPHSGHSSAKNSSISTSHSQVGHHTVAGTSCRTKRAEAQTVPGRANSHAPSRAAGIAPERVPTFSVTSLTSCAWFSAASREMVSITEVSNPSSCTPLLCQLRAGVCRSGVCGCGVRRRPAHKTAKITFRRRISARKPRNLQFYAQPSRVCDPRLAKQEADQQGKNAGLRGRTKKRERKIKRRGRGRVERSRARSKARKIEQETRRESTARNPEGNRETGRPLRNDGHRETGDAKLGGKPENRMVVVMGKPPSRRASKPHNHRAAKPKGMRHED